METLSVGMYVRTLDGIIDKVIIDYNGHCANPNCKYKHISCAKNYYDEDKVVKSSYNIIDILENKDYVNGYPIYEIIEYEDGTKAIVIDNDNKSIIWKKQDIKSVITHEQMEQMAYKVGE